MAGEVTGYEPTNLQKLDQIPIDEIIEYALENFYEQMKEAIQEQAS